MVHFADRLARWRIRVVELMALAGRVRLVIVLCRIITVSFHLKVARTSVVRRLRKVVGDLLTVCQGLHGTDNQD